MRVRLAGALALALVFQPVASAQERAQVVDVPYWDTLNMRAEPKGDAPILRALPAYASNIEVLERRQDWVKVRYFDKEGWVAARHLGAPLTYAGNEPPVPLQCGGTEPFWSLVFDKKTALYRELGTEVDEKLSIQDARASRNDLTTWVMGFDGGMLDRVVLSTDRMCSDGMSDTDYLFRILLMRGDGEVRSGCCNPPR